MNFDSWTSLTGNALLSITAHYIDTSEGTPHKWELKHNQLTFSPTEGNHSGQNIARILLECIESYELGNKVSL